MSRFDPVELPVLTPGDIAYEAATRPTGFGEYLGAKAQQGFDFTLAGRAVEGLTSPSQGAGPLPPDNTPQQNADMGFKPGRRLTEDEWKKLKLDRPGLAFSGGGTVEYEQARTAAYDERRYRDSLVERYQGGLLGQAAGFAAGLVGSVPSPENFVPFVGEGVRAAMVTRMGLIGGRAAAGALDATIGAVIADAGALPDLRTRGEDVGAADFALDVALGAVIGSAFGTGAGLLERRAEARVRREQLAQAARAVRIDGLERQADALEVAMRAVADDQPVDVGPVVADALPKVQERATRQGITAYHGSPHTFDRFSLDKIGTGEGAQAYGHGLYFAENQGIAKGYQEKLAPKVTYADEKQLASLIPDDEQRRGAFGYFNDANGDIDKAISLAEKDIANADSDFYRQMYGDALDGLQKLRDSNISKIEDRSSGSLYTVNLDVEPEDLLDWDAPLSQQSEKVRKAFPYVSPPARNSGADAYNEFAREIMKDPAAASRALAERGIKGIRYFDGGSRAAGEGTRNYVIFDDGLISIKEINGKAVASPEPPHPSVVEAAATVTRAPPKTGVEEAQRLAADMGLDDPPELADIQVMKRDGLLTAADEASLERAGELVKEANGWATAYETLSTCVLRFGR